MAQYRIAVVDDSEEEANTLQAHILKYFAATEDSCTLEIFHGGYSFLDGPTVGYDLIFLDVEMPGLDGLQTAKEIRMKDEEVCLVFITHFAKYAVSGYEMQAFDYMVKPLAYRDFEFKMQRILRTLKRKQGSSVYVKINREILRFDLKEVCYLEQRNHDLYWHLTEKRVYKVKRPLKDAEKELAGGTFLRCNSCYLVNLRHITALRGNIFVVDGEEIIISRAHKKECERAFIDYIGNI